MASQEELIVKIGADLSQLKRELGRAGKETKKFSDESKRAVIGLDKAMAGLAKRALGFGAAFLSVNAALRTFNGAINRTREITKFAGQLDLSRERFGAYAIIARQAGYETEDMFDAMKDLSIKITDAANGAKSYEEVLNKVGLRSRDLLKLNVEERFLAFAKATGSATNAMRQFALDELGSDPLLRFNKLIKESGTELEGIADNFIKTGKAASEFDYKQMEKAAKAQKNLNMAWEKFANVMSVKVAPAIAKALNVIAEAFEDEPEKIDEVKEKTEELRAELLKIQSISFMDRTNEQMERFIELQKKIGEVEGFKGTVKEEVEGGGEKKSSKDALDLEGQNLKASLMLLQDFLAEQKDLRDEASKVKQLDGIEEHALVYAAEEAHMKRMKQLWLQGLKGRMQVAKTFFGDMSVLMQTENRKMFEVGKAAAIANAVITTIESAQKSFNAMAGIPIVGPALGAAAAAAAVAGGMARVQQIKSTTMGGGGGVSDVGGGAGGVTAAAGGGGEQAPINQTNVDVSLQGSTFSQDQVRELIGAINEQADDNFVVRAG
jgi:hypothetical protein